MKSERLLAAGMYGLLGIAAAVVIVFFQFAYPLYSNVAVQLRTQEEALWKMQAILGRKEQVEKEFSLFSKKFSVDTQNAAALSTNVLQEIKSKAGVAGLNVINIKPLSVQEEELAGVFDVKLETEGDMRGFGRFLYDLDNSPYLFTLKFTQINAQSPDEPLKLQMLLSVALAKG